MRAILVFIGLFFIACNVPKQYTEKITITDTLKNNCATSYKKIKREWRKHASKDCYYVRSRFINKGFERIFNECFTGLNMSEVAEIIGPATSISEATDSVYHGFDVYRYSLSPTGRCKYPEWELQFYVTPSTNVVDRIRNGIKTIVN